MNDDGHHANPPGAVKGSFEPAAWLHPVDDIEPEQLETYREIALLAYDYIVSTLSYLLRMIIPSDRPAVTAWAIAYAFGLPMCGGVSMTERCERIGVKNRETFSKQVKTIVRHLNLPKNDYLKTDEQNASLSEANRGATWHERAAKAMSSGD